MKTNIIASLIGSNILLSPDSAEGLIPGVTVAESNEEDTETEDENMIFNPDTGEMEKYLQDGNGNMYVQRDGYKLMLVELGGALKGLGLHVKQFDTIEAALKMHDNADILRALNTATAAGIKRMAKSRKIPTFEDDKATAKALAELRENSPIIFTQNEALEFVPGSRPETLNSLIAQFRDAKKNGERKLMAELLRKITDMEGLSEDEDED